MTCQLPSAHFVMFPSMLHTIGWITCLFPLQNLFVFNLIFQARLAQSLLCNTWEATAKLQGRSLSMHVRSISQNCIQFSMYRTSWIIKKITMRALSSKISEYCQLWQSYRFVSFIFIYLSAFRPNSQTVQKLPVPRSATQGLASNSGSSVKETRMVSPWPNTSFGCQVLREMSRCKSVKW